VSGVRCQERNDAADFILKPETRNLEPET